jgi:hypothetical protein
VNFEAVLYTHNNLTSNPFKYCYNKLKEQVNKLNGRLWVVSSDYLGLNNNIVCNLEDVHPYHALRIYYQISRVFPYLDYKTPLFLCEHDVLYPDSHFLESLDENKGKWLTYNSNVIHMTRRGFEFTNFPHFLSTCCSFKSFLEDAIVQKQKEFDELGRVVHCELAVETTIPVYIFSGTDSILDIRHGTNVTGDRDTGNYEDFNEFWGSYSELSKIVFS